MTIGQSIDGDVYISDCGWGSIWANCRILELRARGRICNNEQGEEQPCDWTQSGKHRGDLRSPYSTASATLQTHESTFAAKCGSIGIKRRRPAPMKTRAF